MKTAVLLIFLSLFTFCVSSFSIVNAAFTLQKRSALRCSSTVVLVEESNPGNKAMLLRCPYKIDRLLFPKIRSETKADVALELSESPSTGSRKPVGRKSESVDDADDDADVPSSSGNSRKRYSSKSKRRQREPAEDRELPGGVVRRMDEDGMSLQEIQKAVLGEYGVVAPIVSLRNRLQREKYGRGNKKYSEVRLPTTGLVTLEYLSRCLSIPLGGLEKFIVLEKGVVVPDSMEIDVSLAKQIVELQGRLVVEDRNNSSCSSKYIAPGIAASGSTNSTEGLENSQLLPPFRAPVVTVMGHVDHGKTTLLDFISQTKVAKNEFGGITQGIRAFTTNVHVDNGTLTRNITFIDTPGHAAFSEMRKRGALVTDIVVLIVAADDGVMEQTVECINAARSAKCPIVVAVNKMDRSGVDINKIFTELLKYDILVEDLGGDVFCSNISALTGAGVQDLLDKIVFQADLLELRANATVPAMGIVLEGRVDKRSGVTCTSVVQSGCLRIGDVVLAGSTWGKVKSLTSADNTKDLKVSGAGPSSAVQIVGLHDVPSAGSEFCVIRDENKAKSVAEARKQLRHRAQGESLRMQLQNRSRCFLDGNVDNRTVTKVPLLVKSDVFGSLDAICTALANLTLSDEKNVCQADVVFSGIGAVTLADVDLASASKARILSFNVPVVKASLEAAVAKNVNVTYFRIIYDLLDDVHRQLHTILAPPPSGTIEGTATVKKIFAIGKVGNIAGCEVSMGRFLKQGSCRVLRGSSVVFEGALAGLRSGKQQVDEVLEGSECGIAIEGFGDFREGDTIECIMK